MSSAIVRQALRLFDDDFVIESTSTRKKKGNDPKKQIGTSKRGVRKQLRKLKKTEISHTEAHGKGLRRKAGKSAVEEYRSRAAHDHTSENLHNLHQLFQMGQTDAVCTETILEQHRGRLAKNRPDKETDEQTTVFTDHDFDVFAKEYLNS